MKLAAAECRPLRMRLREPLVTSRGQLTMREGFVLKLYASSQLLGMGEAAPAYWIGGESIAMTRASLESIVGLVGRGCDSASLREAAFTGSETFRITASAACALDTALLDLEARSRGVSVARLLGGDSTRPVSVCALLRSRTPEQLFRESRIAADRGYTTFKLKVGGDAIENDVAKLAAIRDAVGDAARIRLDANGAWEFADAVTALRRFSTHAIEFIEEPLRDPTPGALAKLVGETGVSVALDESIGTAAQLNKFLDQRCADFIVLKAARLGGPSRAVELARIIAAATLKLVVTDSLESAIGMSLAVHLASAVSGAAAAGLAGTRFFADAEELPAHFREAVELEPCGPGLDVALPAANSLR